MARYSATEQQGVHLVGAAITRVNWIFREQPIADMGIDAHVEVCHDGEPTGELLGLQIKTGDSFFTEKAENGVVFRGNLTHLAYWQRHVLPVILVLVDLRLQTAYWVAVTPQTIERTVKHWKITVPNSQVLSQEIRFTWEKIAGGPLGVQRLRQLALSKPLMLLVQGGVKVTLELDRWVNKSSGRGSAKIVKHVDYRTEDLTKFVEFIAPGWSYESLANELVPWASLSIDADWYEIHDEEEWESSHQIGMADFCCTDWEGYSEWRDGLPEFRAYSNSSGEMEHYRLILSLNPIGEAYLALEEFLTKEIRAPVLGT